MIYTFGNADIIIPKKIYTTRYQKHRKADAHKVGDIPN
jgi:hypothetical protein